MLYESLNSESTRPGLPENSVIMSLLATIKATEYSLRNTGLALEMRRLED